MTEPTREHPGVPNEMGAGAMAASLVLAVVISLPIHLAALRGEAGVDVAMIAFAASLAAVWVLGAFLNWLIGAVDAKRQPLQVGTHEGDPDRRITSC